ncbi:MAG: exopolyphosphatase [Candidatus Cloacimonetes bacterium 4572_55]|nr:MAG: exopolyphosphatase [Candidatus Cloacimonetes bacterium 4572_55]
MKLITRSDFDGLVCAVLLKEVEQIDAIEFAHPKDVQDGEVAVTSNDILTNLPYVDGVGLWFDHHSSEEDRIGPDRGYKGEFEISPSAARVVYNFYKKKTDKLNRFSELLESVDKYDAAQLDREDVTNPKGWILLAFILDPRTGLGYHRDYKISNRQLMRKMIDLIASHSVDEILEMPDVKARIDRYFSSQDAYSQFMRIHSKQIENLVVTDLRGVKNAPAGNRFSIYLIFPQTNISLRIFDGKQGKNVVVAGGYSIFNRTANTDLGALFARYGGGGHKASGTCQLEIEESVDIINTIVGKIVLEG